jgi:hypothetical protein
MRVQLNVPPDAQARQQMLARLHAESKASAEKSSSQNSHGTKRPS